MPLFGGGEHGRRVTKGGGGKRGGKPRGVVNKENNAANYADTRKKLLSRGNPRLRTGEEARTVKKKREVVFQGGGRGFGKNSGRGKKRITHTPEEAPVYTQGKGYIKTSNS